MIDIDIQISISERSSGWATNYLITLSPMKVAKENQRQLERFLQSEAGQSVSQIFVSSTVNINWPGIRVAKSDLNSTEAYFATKN